MEETPLSRGGLLLIALLSQSDYSDGLIGCGTPTAVLLAQSRFGDQILQAFSTLCGVKLDEKLRDIAVQIQNELQYNTSGHLSTCYPGLASKFTVDHILSKRIALYVDPVVSDHTTIPTWLEKEPIVSRIAHFCMGTLSWMPDILEKKIGNVLRPGVAFRILISVRYIRLPYFIILFTDIYHTISSHC